MKRGENALARWMAAAALMLLGVGFLAVPGRGYGAQASKQQAELQPEDVHRMLWEGKSGRFLRPRSSLAKKAMADQEDFDVLHYELSLNVDPVSETIDGVVVVRAQSIVDGLTHVVLDFSNQMTVSSARSGENDLAYDHTDDLIDIALGQSYGLGENFEVVVSYHGRPEEVLSYFGSPGNVVFDTHSGQPVISSFSEPEDARSWWPCKDRPSDKATADINITVPSDLVAASNGLLMEVVENEDATKTYKWHESYPIATYLVSIAISNYVTFSDYYVTAAGDSMEVVFYLYPEHSQYKSKFPVTVEMIAFF